MSEKIYAPDSMYPVVMNSIAGRLGACHDAMKIIENEPEKEDNWVRLDFITLQIRKICELFLLGSTLSHIGEGSAKIDPRKWRPKDAFSQLNQASDHPLPVPLRSEIDRDPTGLRQLQPATKPIPFQLLSAVYGHCGDLLHVPSADKVLKEQITPFDTRKFRGWIDGFAQLLAAHALMLLEFHRILVCTWSGDPRTPPNIILLEADGPVSFNVENLPEFNLFVP